MIKNILYIQYSEFRAQSIFQDKRKLLKNPKCKKYIQYSEKFQSKLCFQGKRKLFKILNDKNIYSIQWNQGKLCLSRQA